MSDELPPLPEPDQVRLGAPDTGFWGESAMYAYAREAVRAAVERERAKWQAAVALIPENVDGYLEPFSDAVADIGAQAKAGPVEMETTRLQEIIDTQDRLLGEYELLNPRDKRIGAQAKAEPVAWYVKTGHGDRVQLGKDNPAPDFIWNGAPAWKPLYAHPPTSEPVDVRAVASILERLENDMCGSNARQDAADLIRKLIAHPPTSE